MKRKIEELMASLLDMTVFVGYGIFKAIEMRREN